MRACLLFTVFVLIASLPAAAAEDLPQLLTLEQRVQAQEAIQQVYYSHQIGATRPFEEAVSHDVLEAKVRRYLKKSAALEVYWNEPVSGAALNRELQRIARETRFPERLHRIFEALGNDPLLILECLARPALVERLTYEWYARKPLVRDMEWSAWWTSAEPTLNEHLVRVPRNLRLDLPAIDGSATFAPDRVGDCESWGNGILDDALQAGEGHTAIWTGNEMLVYGGSLSYAGWRYDPLIDDWTPMARAPFEFLQQQDSFDSDPQHTAVWTGTEMIVWGNAKTPIGGRYDPLGDSWTQTTTAGAPDPRREHLAVWAGGEMIVWGGMDAHDNSHLGNGAVYHAAADSWTPISENGAPLSDSGNVAVWSGSQMLVWGWTSGRYILAFDAWLPMPMLNGLGRADTTAVWTGTEMIVWGGENVGGMPTNAGGRYDPRTNSWTPISTTNAPEARTKHSAVWTGTEMIVWGGVGSDSFSYMNTGGRYDPSTDTWSTLSLTDSPLQRARHSAVWAGDEMIVWGGLAAVQTSAVVNTGGRYDPATDTWLSTSTGVAAPERRSWQKIVWTGTEMIVWGGQPHGQTSGGLPEGGGRYDPLVDAWYPVSTSGAPEEGLRAMTVWSGTEMLVKIWSDYHRYDPVLDVWYPMSSASARTVGSSSVWTGEKWILWGGTDYCDASRTGVMYDPVTDEWSPVSEAGSPAARGYHAAVWTGSEMIVWGGYRHYWHDYGGGQDPVCLPEQLYDGARYNPATNQWTPVTEVGAPIECRRNHSAIWTGTEMIVWGGCSADPRNCGEYNSTNEGGRYDPSTDSWTPTSLVNAPSRRGYHSAVWTGSEMIVWGGSAIAEEGGAYDPATDTWTVPTMQGAAETRFEHSAVWTGNEMIVWGGQIAELGGPLRNNGGIYDPYGPIPGLVASLVVGQPTPGTAHLSWTLAELADTYSVLRGTVSALGDGEYGSFVIQGLPDPEYVDADPVPAEAAFTYLIRGDNACGSGGLGFDSSGKPRRPDPAP